MIQIDLPLPANEPTLWEWVGFIHFILIMVAGLFWGTRWLSKK